MGHLLLFCPSIARSPDHLSRSKIMFPIVPSISLWFAVFVLVMAALLVMAVQAAGRHLNESAKVTNKWIRNTVITLVIFLTITGFLAFKGVLLNFEQVPPPLGIVVLLATMATIFLCARSTWGERLANGLPFQVLIGFQSFRIIIELFLFQLHQVGVIPVQMTFEGLNWDIVTGILALVYLIVQSHISVSRRVLIAFNVIGLIFVTNIVVISTLSTPIAIRVFMNEPANTLIGYVPFIWLPAFLVQLAIGAHLLALRKLNTPG
jgi:hypothetical protein